MGARLGLLLGGQLVMRTRKIREQPGFYHADIVDKEEVLGDVASPVKSASTSALVAVQPKAVNLEDMTATERAIYDKEQEALRFEENMRFNADILARSREVARVEAFSPLGRAHGRVQQGGAVLARPGLHPRGDGHGAVPGRGQAHDGGGGAGSPPAGAAVASPGAHCAAPCVKPDFRRLCRCVVSTTGGCLTTVPSIWACAGQAREMEDFISKRLLHKHGAPGETPGNDEDHVAWLPPPEEVTRMHIEACRSFQQIARSHAAEVPTIMWGVPAAERAKLVSTDFRKPVTALELERELWSPQSTIV